jgi:golgi phosphoprotein 3
METKMTDQPLLLHEQIVLLALRDDKGTPESGAWHHLAIGGAIMAELLLAGRVEVEQTKRKLVNVISEEPIGDTVLDACLGKIASASRRAAASSWVTRFGNRREHAHAIAVGLCKKQILKQDEASVLLIFKRRVYPEIDPAPEKRLVEQLREAIFTDVEEVDPEIAILATIANSAELLKVHFDRKELRARKARLEQLASGDLVGNATKQAVQAAQAAMVMVSIMPAIMVATT